MAIIFVLLIGWLATEIIFFFTHRKPLSDRELRKLMYKRRKKYIRENYAFQATNSYPDKQFKSSMRPSGKLYSAEILLSNFPSYTANLLKGKKHEWVVLACVKDKTVKCFYANKGDDNKSVAFNVDESEMIRLCKVNGYQTILRFHNHPNSDPHHYTHFLASEQDKRSAKYLSGIFLDAGINWIDFVCERGRFLEYSRAFADTFYPEESSLEFVSLQNSQPKMYYKLQRELGIFR